MIILFIKFINYLLKYNIKIKLFQLPIRPKDSNINRISFQIAPPLSELGEKTISKI